MRKRNTRVHNRGQAVVEYLILLIIFTGVAVVGWRSIRLALVSVYTHFTDRRAGMEGMRP